MAQSKADKAEKASAYAEAYPVTDEAPAQDDRTGAVIGDAGHEDSPVRTARPDQPIAGVMAGGVGEHKPADPDVFNADGRLRGDVRVADNTAETREDTAAQRRTTR